MSISNDSLSLLCRGSSHPLDALPAYPVRPSSQSPVQDLSTAYSAKKGRRYERWHDALISVFGQLFRRGDASGFILVFQPRQQRVQQSRIVKSKLHLILINPLTIRRFCEIKNGLFHRWILQYKQSIQALVSTGIIPRTQNRQENLRSIWPARSAN